MSTTGPTFPLPSGISAIRLVVQTNSNKHNTYLNAIKADPNNTLNRIEAFFAALGVGAYRSNVDINTGGTNASGTITFSSLANNDTITVNGTVFTAKTSGASGAVQFNLGANDTAAAANAVAALNANTAINSTLFGQSTGAVITLTCRVPGVIGNLCTIAISAHGSVSGANLASGADGTNSNTSHGL
jgi:hypothetical protein